MHLAQLVPMYSKEMAIFMWKKTVENGVRRDIGGFVFKSKYCLSFLPLFVFFMKLPLQWFFFSPFPHLPFPSSTFLCCAGFCTHPARLNIPGSLTFMTPNSLQIRMIFCHTGLTFSWKNLLSKRSKKGHVRGSEVLSSLRAKDTQYLLSFNRPPT